MARGGVYRRPKASDPFRFLSLVLLPLLLSALLRYACCHVLGFHEAGEYSAVEGFSSPVVSQLSLGLWRGGRERRRSAVSNLDLRRFAASVSGRHSAWEDVSRRFIEPGFLLLSAVGAGLVSGLKSGCLFRLNGLLLGSPSSVLFFVVPTMISMPLVVFPSLLRQVTALAAPVSASWARGREYGEFHSFYSFRHRVQAGAMKPRRAVLGWVIIFKSGSPRRLKLPGSDSWLNLAHSFASSCCCGLGRASGKRFWLLCMPCPN
ncbi:hypothetical protein DY000_02003246 [Brassica cretica]|uniref:Uncharacterized protein n=1 Tax=Brassica cretica TaxID=69181 RepID=A0ABQ7CJC8_BRACR|nr:hypothetical protein DY000_02003246 [Brassica cretica]